MWKSLALILPLIALSSAAKNKLNITSGFVIQGKNNSGVIVKHNGENQVIEWQEKFDKDNSLKISQTFIYTNTGLTKQLELDNLCANYNQKTMKQALKKFVVVQLGNSWKCPINKGKSTISFPMTFNYEAKEAEECGPFLAIFTIARNDPKDAKKSPVVLSATFRGTITHDNC